MSTKRKNRQARLARRAANQKAARAAVSSILNPPPPPAERDLPAGIEAQIVATDNVIDIPLGLLRIHQVHGARNPYHDTPAGLVRRKRCHLHIRRAGGWDQTACETLTVFLDSKGVYWIINGAGRLYMAAELSGGLAKVLPCRVLTGLSEAQIRILFNRMGTEITRISKYDAWRANIGLPGHGNVTKIVNITDSFGTNMPKVTLPVLLFAYEMLSPATGEPVLETAIADVINTSIGLNRKHTSIFTAAIAALRGTNKNLRQDRLRHVIGKDDEFYTHRMFDKAKKIANTLGYTRPHARTITWRIAILIGEDYNKYDPQGGRLDLAALDALKTPHYDAFSTEDPPKKKGKPS